jgi:hypothetical protein
MKRGYNMGRKVWVGEHLWNIINLPIKELQVIYPDYTVGGLKSKKSYWNAKIKTGEIAMPPKPANRETSPEVHTGKLVKTWEVARGTGDDEWDIVTLHAYDHAEEAVETWEPVEPAKIRPTKLKRAKRASKFILAYGDGQVGFRRIVDAVTGEEELVPMHNEAVHNIIQQLNSEYRPETTVNLGDFADFPELSRFDADSDHFHKTLGPAMRYIHDFYAQMRADNPDARHVEVDSNHAVRIKKQILKHIPALHDFVRPGEDYAMMTYYYLANLGKLGIDFVSGYGAAEFVYGEEYEKPPIVFKHGTHSSSNPGATVRKESAENPEVNVVRGHGHKHEQVMRTMRNGHQLFYVQLGSACLNNGPVPGYASAVDDRNRPVKKQLNHQNTLAVIEDYQNGQYQVDVINVMDGRAFYRGKEYNGNAE